MNRILKWVLAMAATVAVLLLVLSIVLPLLLDPNNYKDEINAAILKETGRELNIAGDISWRVFPSVGLEIEQLSLANRAGFGVQPMLEVSDASVILELFPLFSRQLEIDRIELEGVSAYLRSNTDGHNNWEDLVDRGTAAAQEAPAEMEIEVSRGNFSLENTARRVDFDVFSTSSAPATPSQAFVLKGWAELRFLQPEVAGEIEFEGLIQALRGQGLLGFEGVEFDFKGSKGPAGDSLPLALKASTDVFVDLARDEASLTELTLQFFDLTAAGALNITQLSSEPEFDGQLQVSEFSPKLLLQDLGMEAPPTRNPDVFGKLQAEFDFSGSGSGLDIAGLKAVLDHSTLDGRLVIEAFEPLQLSFDLAVDSLNLDDYSLLAVTEDSTEVGGAGLAVGSMLFFNGGGDLSIGRLVTGGLTAEDFEVTIRSDANEIRLFPMGSRLYGGQHQGDIRLNFAAAPPTLTVNQVVTGFETSTLLRDLVDTDRLHGTGDLYLKVHTRLGSEEQTRRSLSGDVGLSVVDGVIDDIDVRGMVDKVTALLGEGNETASAVGATDRMEFSELIITGIIDQGILKSDDLALRSALVNASGKGTVNLVKETVSYVIYPVLVNELAAQLPVDYRNLSFPVRVSGNLYEPDISLDIAAGIMASQNANIVNEAGEAAGSLLQELLGKKKDKPKKKDGQ
ncbi:MAG: AsmA family protein [Xanthomonadales bacterium]|nr:AsmA family protein [Xanthomonadales bacterium]